MTQMKSPKLTMNKKTAPQSSFSLNGLIIPGIIFSWFILFSYACSSGKPQKSSEELPYELIEIPITYPYLSDYISKFEIASTDSGDIMVAYNHWMTSLDFFDITHKKPSHSVPLAQDGPDRIPDIRTFSIDDSSIVMQSRSDFIRINLNANILSKMSVNRIVDSVYRYDQIENYTIFHYGATLGNYISSDYSTESKQFLHCVYPQEGNFDLDYLGVIGASFNLEDSSTTFIPIRYPEMLKQKNYGSLSCANFIQNGDLIIYNFPFSSKVYTYHIKTGKLKEYNPQSTFTGNEAKPMDQKQVSPQDQYNYDNCALRFRKLYYIKKHNV